MKNTSFIQHISGNFSQYNKARKGNERHADWRERNTTADWRERNTTVLFVDDISMSKISMNLKKSPKTYDFSNVSRYKYLRINISINYYKSMETN